MGYPSPTLPHAARAGLDAEVVDDIELELDTLGRTVSELRENDSLLRDDERFGFFADDTSENSTSPVTRGDPRRSHWFRQP